MQTIPGNEKGLSGTNAQTLMQTTVNSRSRVHVAQVQSLQILTPRHSRILEALLMGEGRREEIDEIAGADRIKPRRLVCRAMRSAK